MLGHALPVQELVGGDGALHRVDVKVAVQVALPVDGVPEREGGGGWGEEDGRAASSENNLIFSS